VAAAPMARSAGGVSIRLELQRSSVDVAATSGSFGALRAAAAPPAASPDTGAFDAAVMASRRPFVRRVCHPHPAGRWAGPLARPRRFRGLAAAATVVRAHRHAQADDHVALEFGE
jgi:hypothetical protein